MKESYQSKLKTYSSIVASLGLMSVLGNEANAQVIYTDVNPDNLLDDNGETFNIDFDGDNAYDLSFSAIRGTYSYTPPYSLPNLSSYSYLLLSNGKTMTYAWNVNRTDRLNFGTVIGSSQTFHANSYSYLFQAKTTTNTSFNGMADNGTTPWVEGTVDKYIGVKFLVGSNTHYGWALVSVNSLFTVTVKAYAYNATAGASITTGQGIPASVFNAETEVSKISLFENVLSLKDMTQAGDMTLVNSNGSEVLKTSVKQGDNTYTLDGLQTGMYLVKVNLGNNIITKKVVVN